MWELKESNKKQQNIFQTLFFIYITGDVDLEYGQHGRDYTRRCPARDADCHRAIRILIIAAIVLTKLLRVPYEDVGLYRFMILFGNVAFVGYPVLSAVLGNDALFFAAILNLPFNILVFTLGITFITHGTDQHQKLELKVFLNPGLIATVIGLILFFASIQLPTFVNELLADVGDMTTPLSLLVIGASLYGVDIRSIFKKR